MTEVRLSVPERILSAASGEIAVWSLDRIYSDPQAAIQHVSAALAVAAEINDRAAANFVLGAAYSVTGELGRAEASLDEAEELYRSLGDELALAHVLLRRDLVWHQREQFDLALARLPQILPVARKYHDLWLEGATLSDIAMINLRIGNTGIGMEGLFNALAVAERGGDQSMLNVLRANLAGTFLELRDATSARAWLERILEDPLGDRRLPLIFDCTRLLASCAELLGDNERAIELIEEARRVAEELVYPFGMGEMCYDDGIQRTRLGQTTEAVRSFRRSIEQFALVDTPIKVARIAMAEWWCEHIEGNYSEEVLQKLLDVAERGLVAPYERAFDLHDSIAQSAEALGHANLAVAHLRKSRALAEEYWSNIANRQAQVALRRFQLETAERAAERERRLRQDLAGALAASEAMNSQNRALLSRLRLQAAALEKQAIEDPLTQMANRRYFDRQLERETARSREFITPLSVGLADIDNFKEINDLHSHQVGDQVLKRVGAIVSERVRSIDTVARYGGEEFAFIFPDANEAQARELAESIRAAVESHDWNDLGSTLVVTLSVGLVTSTGGATEAGLIEIADQLLYRSKRRGKNQVSHQHVDFAVELASRPQ